MNFRGVTKCLFIGYKIANVICINNLKRVLALYMQEGYISIAYARNRGTFCIYMINRDII